MSDPVSLSALLLKQMQRFELGTREYRIRKSLIDAIDNSRDCRALVLSRADVAPRLCEPPLDYHKPEQWNGFIPPEIWDDKHNNSPRRSALIGLLEQAMETP